MRKNLFLLGLIVVAFLFFWKFFLHGLLPIPADTIVGMYHPWRDLLADKYPSGIPFKNFLITDPVRQQYSWRKLAIELLKQGKWPLWNPYAFAGTPLLANFQSASFYPLNVLLFFLPFDISWSILVILEPLLAGLFLFLYLRHFSLRSEACFLGAITFAFSGFFIAWLEWNTVLHVALWLPLILLCLEKILSTLKSTPSEFTSILKSIEVTKWGLIFIFSLISSFFAGHLQIFFYVFLTSLIYAIVRIFSLKKKERGKAILLFTIYYLLFTIFTSIQWIPTLQFINLSARDVDQLSWHKEGWFLPWQHLTAFLAPDFFGNPTTLNYWGVWNYGELVGYIGVLPFIMAILALVWRKDKKTLFFGSLFFLSLFFALPTPLAKLPYLLRVPFLSTSQPTRLLFLTDFSLVILAASGFDWWLRKSSMVRITKLLMAFFLVYGGLWAFVLLGGRWLNTEDWIINLAVAKRNLILPTGLFVISAAFLFFSTLLKNKRFKLLAVSCLLLTVIFDLFRFGWKFTPFTKREYLFPKTSVINFLQKQTGPFRIMAADRRILPPNFSMVYKLQTVEGYDPLYPRRFGELIIASEREKPDISPPLGFNRIITPQNYNSRIMDLLNVKYVLSLKDENSPKLQLVFQEGETRVYENKNVYPRAFLVKSVVKVENRQDAIEKLLDKLIDLRREAVVHDDINISTKPLTPNEEVKIVKYSENNVELQVKTDASRLLVLVDNYYPNWKVFVDGREGDLYQVDYNLRGVVVPSGKHDVLFKIDMI